MKSPHVEIYRGKWISANQQTWGWRFCSSNGRILSVAAQGYNDPRDLVRGLELSFPGYRMQDVDGNLDGVGGWYLWPWMARATLDVPVIRVRVPAGTVKLWRSRRNR